ncbi:DUF4394 domain-containing protein [Frigidibacter oleivorans]|uniref:DUF4394 domain-containing protein n=1 Tax=Frigidibacter oleivorans TaxID=2487129 RepID=UPI000F8E309E|nr:DUF4394 domain-containing protein [Frigidibacter oleivorans]
MKTLATALLTLAAAGGAAQADTALGLVGDKTLVWIDTATAQVTGMVEAEGVDRLLGVDLRPSNNTVIGVTEGQAIVTIDPKTGATTELSQMNTMLPVADMPVIVDVNPAADRLRFMSGTTNHRVNMDTGEVTVDGALHFDAADANASATPMVVAVAYINSFGKPEKTAMYDIDTGLGALLQQTAPNDGTLATIGMFDKPLEGAVAMDVATTEDGTNTAWLASGGMLHTVDLATGATTGSWQIEGLEGELRDLTVLPAM